MTGIFRWSMLTAVVFCLGCGQDAPGGEASSGSSTTASLLENPPPAEQTREVNVTQLGHNEGDIQAPVYIVEFSDFGCGYCRKFHLETLPALRGEYIEAGEVGWKIIPFVNGMFENSRAAASAAECAARQDRFQDMSHRLFQDQSEWKPADDPAPHLRRYAQEMGLSMDQFDACVSEDRGGSRIDEANRAAAQLGVRATPTFFIDGYPVQGAIPLDLFREVLDTRLAEVEEARGGNPGS